MKKRLLILLCSLLCINFAFSLFTPNYAEGAKPKKAQIVKTQKKESIVYITRTGHKYHKHGCRYLRRSCMPTPLSKAQELGYTPCSICW